MSDDTEHLRDLLHRAVADINGVDFDGLATRAQIARPARRGHRVAVATTSACVIVAVVVTLIVVALASSGRRQLTMPAEPPGQDYAALVLHDGDRVRATGQVTAVPGRATKFCMFGGVLFRLRPAGARTIQCALGVDVTGVDLAVLADRVDHHGAIQGSALLTGIWRHGSITVTHQSKPAPSDPGPDRSLTHVPCPAPAGGWPDLGSGTNLDMSPLARYRHAHPGVIGSTALLHPGPGRNVAYALTRTDPGPVQQALNADFPGGLCVVRSRYSPAEIHAADNAFDLASPLAQATGMVSVGPGRSQVYGQPQITVNLLRVTPAVVKIAAAQPVGLVVLEPWLRPIRR